MNIYAIVVKLNEPQQGTDNDLTGKIAATMNDLAAKYLDEKMMRIRY